MHFMQRPLYMYAILGIYQSLHNHGLWQIRSEFMKVFNSGTYDGLTLGSLKGSKTMVENSHVPGVSEQALWINSIGLFYIENMFDIVS